MQAQIPHKPQSRPVQCECGRGQRDRYAQMCLRCRQDAGYFYGDRRGRPLKISEEVLADARRMYDQGDSFRRLAERILDRTTYATPSACAESIRHQFKVRGWQARERAAATAQANRRRATVLEPDAAAVVVRAQDGREVADLADVLANAPAPTTGPNPHHWAAHTLTILPPRPTLRMRSWEQLDYSAQRDAAYECPHGSLPHDHKIECECWFRRPALEALPSQAAAAVVPEQDRRAA